MSGLSVALNINAASGSATASSAIAKASTVHEREPWSAAATIQKGKITNPRVAAQRLYNAWKKKSKKSALKAAAPAAVGKLFSVKWRPMKFKGCHNTGGSFDCIYRDSKLDLDISMVVEGGASTGYHVESVSFSTEAVFAPAPRPSFIQNSRLWPSHESSRVILSDAVSGW
ncbi:MAG: hypothetical protein H0U54_04345 [Acidobacteria bacterium]|nr:hypothetical protein [Acidobacteriota bacterium]